MTWYYMEASIRFKADPKLSSRLFTPEALLALLNEDSAELDDIRVFSDTGKLAVAWKSNP